MSSKPLIYNGLEPLKKATGAHIRTLRKAHGYKTVEDFAEALDVHPNSVGELERGANWISPEMLEKMVALMDLSPAAFFPESDEIKAAPSANPQDISKMLSGLAKIRPDLLARLSSLDNTQIEHFLGLAEEEPRVQRDIEALIAKENDKGRKKA